MPPTAQVHRQGALRGRGEGGDKGEQHWKDAGFRPLKAANPLSDDIRHAALGPLAALAAEVLVESPAVWETKAQGASFVRFAWGLHSGPQGRGSCYASAALTATCVLDDAAEVLPQNKLWSGSPSSGPGPNTTPDATASCRPRGLDGELPHSGLHAAPPAPEPVSPSGTKGGGLRHAFR